MFNEIVIDAYRGLKNIELQELGAVNVLIGSNNSGKTSILEAIRLLESKDLINKMYRIASEREPRRTPMSIFTSKYEYVKYVFPVSESVSTVEMHSTDSYGNYNYVYAEMEQGVISEEALRLSDRESRTIEFYLNDENKINVLRGKFKINADNEIHEAEYVIPQIGRLAFEKNQYGVESALKEKSKIKYISPADVYFGGYVSSFLRGLTKAEKDKLISLMNVFDKSIVNIESSTDGRKSQVNIENDQHIVKPLSVYGDGMKRVFSAAGAIAGLKEGVLLIDEFDTGIHGTALFDYTKFLSEASLSNHTQLFLTTHSGDAINALIEAYDGGINLNVYKLDSYNGSIFVRKYDGTELHHMWLEQGTTLL